MRSAGGRRCRKATAPTEPAGETKKASEMGAQSAGRDLFSGSLGFTAAINKLIISKKIQPKTNRRKVLLLILISPPT